MHRVYQVLKRERRKVVCFSPRKFTIWAFFSLSMFPSFFYMCIEKGVNKSNPTPTDNAWSRKLFNNSKKKTGMPGSTQALSIWWEMQTRNGKLVMAARKPDALDDDSVFQPSSLAMMSSIATTTEYSCLNVERDVWRATHRVRQSCTSFFLRLGASFSLAIFSNWLWCLDELSKSRGNSSALPTCSALL